MAAKSWRILAGEVGKRSVVVLLDAVTVDPGVARGSRFPVGSGARWSVWSIDRKRVSSERVDPYPTTTVADAGRDVSRRGEGSALRSLTVVWETATGDA